MASTTTSCFSPLFLSRRHKHLHRVSARTTTSSDSSDQTRSGRANAKPFVDTRIHWANQEDGWIGRKSQPEATDAVNKEYLGEKFADLISRSTATHYQFLGVPVDADMEEIKAAYRRLSKEYHPDTTSLPLKTASQKFMQLREAYNVLSKEESRRFYDWTLAQEAASRRAAQMRMKIEDPYEQDVEQWESIPDMVDRLGGTNMKLSDQAVTALTVDIVIILIAICSIIYVVVFKEPYW